ncbi:MAG: VOC family protein [Prevotella sp.]|uniref:VOC family protein n=1 Tax=Prevotella sp. TaxID=59823 RepID=UPI002A80E355|nr:VOC family protein [Prevotella sp.]MDY4020052.1 VOC family protein [Prevotella sp.]
MFKSKAPDATRKWYENMLGIEDDPYGYKFEWIDKEDTGKTGVTVWSPMPEDSDYLGDADQQYMINYRVHNLERLTVQLRENGVVILDEIEEYEGLGKFLHIIDIDGRRVELWEPA